MFLCVAVCGSAQDESYSLGWPQASQTYVAVRRHIDLKFDVEVTERYTMTISSGRGRASTSNVEIKLEKDWFRSEIDASMNMEAAGVYQWSIEGVVST